ncbi:tetratricopeptide repeat protein [Cognatilysobacter segetis]|uniref:tetratricopeptide repeat protein n=1 Tax=Cognatilysobacter segetis TaxID=2492394 RepID=UPI001EE44E4A|nr:cytochrome C biogenesis protein [Lysobacter segetis]
MNYGFIAAALVLGLAVLVPAFWPLIRRRPAVGGLLAGAALVLVSSMYLLVGSPAALDPANVRTPDTLAGAVQRLETELARQPAQPDGWRLLADAYRAQGRVADVARALGQAVRYSPRDADLLAQAAEARALAAPDRRFDADAMLYLQRALAVQPSHQRSRWFMGVAQRQAGKPADAAATWQALLPDVDPATATALRPQIDAARADAGLPPLPAAPAARMLSVVVDIDPALRRTLPADAAVFVIAREPGGAPMPVAAKRITLADLPATLTLSDADSPMPTRRLSQLAKVEVLARVSRSGTANATPGDLESAAQVVASDGRAKLAIDHARP